MTRVSTVEARNRFSNIINRVAFREERVILTRRGEDLVALVPLEDVKALEKLEDLLDIIEARAAIAEAEEKGVRPLREFLAEQGLL